MNETRKDAVNKILKGINTGYIVRDDKLFTERDLVDILEISRPVLREALVSLEGMGVLDIRDRQGIYISQQEDNAAKILFNQVRGLPMTTLSWAMEMRQILDPAVAALSAVRRTEQDIAQLKECLTEMYSIIQYSSEHSAQKGAYWNTTFHMIIVSATQNEYLIRVCEGLFSTVEQAISLMRIQTPAHEYGGRMMVFEEHEQLYNSIKKRNISDAEDIATKHLHNTIKRMVNLGQILPMSDLYSQHLLGKRNI